MAAVFSRWCSAGLLFLAAAVAAGPAGAQGYARTDRGFPDEPIIEAAKSDDVAAVKAAIVQGARPNDRSKIGMPALVVAAWAQSIDVARYLLDIGADPDARFKDDGSTALQVAAHLGSIELVDLLISHGARVDLEDRRGTTPLIAAAATGRRVVVERLIQAGAEVNHTDYSGRTALWHAEQARVPGLAAMIRDAGGDY